MRLLKLLNCVHSRTTCYDISYVLVLNQRKANTNKKTESIFIIHDIFNWSKLRAIDNTKFGYSINQSTTSVILVTVHWFIQALNVQDYPLYAFSPYHITRQILYAYTIKSVLICFCNLGMISASYLLVCDNQNFCM